MRKYWCITNKYNKSNCYTFNIPAYTSVLSMHRPCSTLYSLTPGLFLLPLLPTGAAVKAKGEANYTGGEDLEFEDFARLRRGQSVDQGIE